MRDLLFEIPVYRLSIRAAMKEEDADIRNRLEVYTRAVGNPTREQLEAQRRRFAIWHWNAPYPYNEAVGWVRIHGGNPVKAYGYKVRQTRVVRGFRLHYNYIDKLFEVWFTDESSETIVAEIRDELLDLTRKGRPFAGRHVDLEAFDNVTLLLDWRKMLGLRPI